MSAAQPRYCRRKLQSHPAQEARPKRGREQAAQHEQASDRRGQELGDETLSRCVSSGVFGYDKHGQSLPHAQARCPLRRGSKSRARHSYSQGVPDGLMNGGGRLNDCTENPAKPAGLTGRVSRFNDQNGLILL